MLRPGPLTTNSPLLTFLATLPRFWIALVSPAGAVFVSPPNVAPPGVVSTNSVSPIENVLRSMPVSNPKLITSPSLLLDSVAFIKPIAGILAASFASAGATRIFVPECPAM